MICSDLFSLLNPFLRFILPSSDNAVICYPEWFKSVIVLFHDGQITVQEYLHIILYLYNNNLLSIT